MPATRRRRRSPPRAPAPRAASRRPPRRARGRRGRARCRASASACASSAGIADPARLRARLAQARDARLDRAGVERRPARLELADRRGAVPAAGRGGGILLAGRAAHPRVGRAAQLAPEQHLARVGVVARRGDLARARAGSAPAARGRSRRTRRARARARRARRPPAARRRASRPSAASRSTPSHMPASAPALHEQPRLEDRARRPASTPSSSSPRASAGSAVPGDEREHVDGCPRRQPELERVAGEHVGAAERAAQLRERPAQRAERVVGVGEDQLRQLRARDAALGQQRGTRARPRTCGRAVGRRRPVALDLRPSQQSDRRAAAPGQASQTP